MSQKVLEPSAMIVRKSEVNPSETTIVSQECVRPGVPNETVFGPISMADKSGMASIFSIIFSQPGQNADKGAVSLNAAGFIVNTATGFFDTMYG